MMGGPTRKLPPAPNRIDDWWKREVVIYIN